MIQSKSSDIFSDDPQKLFVNTDNSVTLTAIKWSCNPDNYLTYLLISAYSVLHTISNRSLVDHFELLNSLNNFVFSNLVSYGQRHVNTTKI